MTCIIAVKTVGGGALLAADTSISWKRDRYVFRDELVKLHGLTSLFCFALSTKDLKHATQILLNCREEAEIIEARLLKKGRVWHAAHSLRRLLYRKWPEAGPATGIIIGISYGGEGRFFWWRNKPAEATKELRPGQCRIMGSINNDPSLAIKLQCRIGAVAQAKAGMIPIPVENAAAILNTYLTDFFKGDVARTVKVGGLFQIVWHNGSGFVHSSSHSTRFSNKPEARYRVALQSDKKNHRWVQIDKGTDTAVPLIPLDEHSFSFTTEKKFTY